MWFACSPVQKIPTQNPTQRRVIEDKGLLDQADSRTRADGPKPDALPDCAMPRQKRLRKRPVRAFDTRSAARQQARPAYRPISGEATRSPGEMPSLRAVPAITSSTKRTGPPEGMTLVDIGSVFSAMRRIRPSPLMKIMSSGM
jgi:hypothetical protein